MKYLILFIIVFISIVAYGQPGPGRIDITIGLQQCTHNNIPVNFGGIPVGGCVIYTDLLGQQKYGYDSSYVSGTNLIRFITAVENGEILFSDTTDLSGLVSNSNDIRVSDSWCDHDTLFIERTDTSGIIDTLTVPGIPCSRDTCDLIVNVLSVDEVEIIYCGVPVDTIPQIHIGNSNLTTTDNTRTLTLLNDFFFTDIVGGYGRLWINVQDPYSILELVSVDDAHFSLRSDTSSAHITIRSDGDGDELDYAEIRFMKGNNSDVSLNQEYTFRHTWLGDFQLLNDYTSGFTAITDTIISVLNSSQDFNHHTEVFLLSTTTLDNTLDSILVRDFATGQIKLRSAGTLGGGGADGNFAHNNLIANANRSHDWDNFDLSITDINQLILSGTNIGLNAVSDLVINTDILNLVNPPVLNNAVDSILVRNFDTGDIELRSALTVGIQSLFASPDSSNLLILTWPDGTPKDSVNFFGDSGVSSNDIHVSNAWCDSDTLFIERSDTSIILDTLIVAGIPCSRDTCNLILNYLTVSEIEIIYCGEIVDTIIVPNSNDIYVSDYWTNEDTSFIERSDTSGIIDTLFTIRTKENDIHVSDYWRSNDTAFIERTDTSGILDTLFIILPDSTDTNFANTNLTADNDRSHDWDGFDLTINDIDFFLIDATSELNLNSDNIISMTSLTGEYQLGFSPPTDNTEDEVMMYDDGTGYIELRDISSFNIHDPVTLSGTPDYITLSGQDIIRGQIDLTADITGSLPVANNTTFTAHRILFTDATTGKPTVNGTWNTLNGLSLYDNATRMLHFVSDNIKIGSGAGGSTFGSSQAVIIGNQASPTVTNTFSTIIGYEAGNDLANFNVGNTLLGWRAGDNLTSGTPNAASYNTFIGFDAGAGVSSGTSNLIIQAGSSASLVTSGIANNSGNIILGHFITTSGPNGNRNLFIGNNAGSNITGSDQLVIENTTAAVTDVNKFIYGDMANDSLYFGASLTIRDIPHDNSPDSVLVIGPGRVISKFHIGSISGGGSGGGSDTNFAEDDLTADANRSHDFATFDLSVTDIGDLILEGDDIYLDAATIRMSNLAIDNDRDSILVWDNSAGVGGQIKLRDVSTIGGGSDTNFAEDNLTADANRSHDFDAFDLSIFDIGELSLTAIDDITLETTGAGTDIYLTANDRIIAGNLAFVGSAFDPQIVATNDLTIISSGTGMFTIGTNGTVDIIDNTFIGANSGQQLEIVTSASDVRIGNDASFADTYISFNNSSDISLIAADTIFFNSDELKLVNAPIVNNSADSILVRTNGVVELRLASSISGGSDGNFAENNLTANADRTHDFDGFFLSILGLDSLSFHADDSIFMNTANGSIVLNAPTEDIILQTGGTGDIYLITTEVGPASNADIHIISVGDDIFLDALDLIRLTADNAVQFQLGLTQHQFRENEIDISSTGTADFIYMIDTEDDIFVYLDNSDGANKSSYINFVGDVATFFLGLNGASDVFSFVRGSDVIYTTNWTTGVTSYQFHVEVPNQTYGAGWNGSSEVATKNAIYDKIETLGPAGSTGEIQFNNAGAFGADANLFWDNTNKRLGIGTATPATTLDVYHTTGAGLTLSRGDVSINDVVDIYAGGGADGIRIISGTGYNSVLNSSFQFWDNGSSFAGVYIDACASCDLRLRDGVQTNFYISGATGNIGTGGIVSFGTSAVNILGIGNGTAPTTAPANMIQLWSADVTAGQAQLFARGESGNAEQLTALSIRNTSNWTVTSSTLLTSITNFWRHVEAGKTYKFEAILYTTSNAAGGVKASMTCSCSATSIIYEGYLINANTIAGQARGTALNTNVAAVTAVTAATIYITGTIVVNAAGNLAPAFAQNVSNGTGSVVLAGSTFKLTPLSN